MANSCDFFLVLTGPAATLDHVVRLLVAGDPYPTDAERAPLAAMGLPPWVADLDVWQSAVFQREGDTLQLYWSSYQSRWFGWSDAVARAFPSLGARLCYLWEGDLSIGSVQWALGTLVAQEDVPYHRVSADAFDALVNAFYRQTAHLRPRLAAAPHAAPDDDSLPF